MNKYFELMHNRNSNKKYQSFKNVTLFIYKNNKIIAIIISYISYMYNFNFINFINANI